jgi:hypothetical protein
MNITGDTFTADAEVIEYDCFQIPIFIHTIKSVADLRGGWMFEDGIHYAVNEVRDEKALRSVLIEKLHESLNDFNAPPAGHVRGVINSALCHSNRLTPHDIDEIYAMGINPIRFINGALVIWGQRIVNRGSPQNMYWDRGRGKFDLNPWFEQFSTTTKIRWEFPMIWDMSKLLASAPAPEALKTDYLAAIHDICKAEQ